MKIYTRRGDSGATDLFGGQRVHKDHQRVEAVGTVDELNAHLGHAAVACASEDWRQTLTDLQNRLFEIGADLATPRRDGKEGGDPPAIPRLGTEQVEAIEGEIDRCWADLPEMTHFILPGGCDLASRLHIARTVCRRAERECVALHHLAPVGDSILIYLNRLGDLLFALARAANHRAGVADVPWISPRQHDRGNEAGPGA